MKSETRLRLKDRNIARKVAMKMCVLGMKYDSLRVSESMM